MIDAVINGAQPRRQQRQRRAVDKGGRQARPRQRKQAAEPPAAKQQAAMGNGKQSISARAAANVRPPRSRSNRFVQLLYEDIETPAFAALSCYARALLIEFDHEYDGNNNGEIILPLKRRCAGSASAPSTPRCGHSRSSRRTASSSHIERRLHRWRKERDEVGADNKTANQRRRGKTAVPQVATMTIFGMHYVQPTDALRAADGCTTCSRNRPSDARDAAGKRLPIWYGSSLHSANLVSASSLPASPQPHSPAAAWAEGPKSRPRLAPPTAHRFALCLRRASRSLVPVQAVQAPAPPGSKKAGCNPVTYPRKQTIRRPEKSAGVFGGR